MVGNVYLAKVQTARFYFAKLFPQTASLMLTVRSGDDTGSGWGGGTGNRLTGFEFIY